MTALVRDLRLAVRVHLGTKTWTLVVLLSLALGIGANTALFTAVNGLLLQTVRVREPERLVRFNHETVHAAMREIDPAVPVQEFTSQSEHISQRFAQERLFARAYSGFGALAVLLACIGLFGLMSHDVARRTTEIGVRMALGAQRKAVVAMVMRESLRLVVIGVVLGLAAVLWAGRFVQSVVYGLSPSDLLTIGVAVALITAVTAFAGGLPARRASNVNPIDALRR